MNITDIRRMKKGLYGLYADGQFLFHIHMDILASSGLKEGQDIEPSALEGLRILSDEKFAREYALRLLSARAYASGGLRKKLRTRFDSEIAESAAAAMEELGLIDDMDFARRFAADCVSLRGYSPERAGYALMEKGVPRDIAAEAVAELEDDNAPRIAAVILRKYMAGLDTEKGRSKAFNALMRLGYRYGDIRSVIENLLEDADYYAEDD